MKINIKRFFCIFRIIKVLMQEKRSETFWLLGCPNEKERFDWKIGWKNKTPIYV